MKIIWYSTSPHVGVGYGVATYALVSRMLADGHEVKIATKHHIGGQLHIDGMDIFDGQELGLIDEVVKTEGYDYVISFNDAWAFEKFGVSFEKDHWVATLFLDTEFIHPKMASALRKSKFQIAVTQHGREELERTNFSPLYAPLGVDTELFSPNEEYRREFRAKRDIPEDTFVIGTVGINYATDRKNFVGLIKAFQIFHNNHPDSVLYLHTDIMGSATANKALPLGWVSQCCGFPQNGTGAVKWVEQKPYHLWSIPQEELVKTYNGMDIFVLPTLGEGFGLPVIESQSCGCPVILSATTSCPELNKGGWTIPVTDDDYEFSTLLTWFARVRPTIINEYLEKAYQAWKSGELKSLGEQARAGMFEYAWDEVYDKHWRPALKFLEEEKRKSEKSDESLEPSEFKTVPDYSTLRSKISDRPFASPCLHFCPKWEECPRWKNNHFLPEEEENYSVSQSLLAKSWPLVPREDGTFLIDTDCPYNRWMSPRFLRECGAVWEGMFRYPKIRKEIAELWENESFNGDYVKFSEISREFDQNYADVLQVPLITTFRSEYVAESTPKGGKILDVGAGDGRRVKELRELGYDVIGTEINECQVNKDSVIFGDAYNLPFKDETFDTVMSVDVLEHLKDPIKAFLEMARVSKDRIVTALTTTEDATLMEDPTHVVFWSSDQWKRELSEFADIEKVYKNGNFCVRKRKSG